MGREQKRIVGNRSNISDGLCEDATMKPIILHNECKLMKKQIIVISWEGGSARKALLV